MTAADVEVEVLVYTAQEACTALRISESFLRTWTRRTVRPLPHFKSGDRIFYPIALVKQWLVDESNQGNSNEQSIGSPVAAGTTQRAGLHLKK